MGSEGYDDHDSRGGSPLATVPVTETAVEPLLPDVEEPATVLLAGGTGFVGRHLARRLLARGHRVRLLSRHAPSGRVEPGAEWREADLTRPATLEGAARGCDAVVHLVGIADEKGGASFRLVHVEGTRHLLAEAERAGVERFVYLSAVGARGDGGPFFRTKYEAELLVRDAAPGHVIFRPSVIYGPDDHFTSALRSLLRGLPVFPILGVGSLRLQPVSIEDVADALVQAVERPELEWRTFELVGPERLKFAKIVRVVARALRLERPVLHLPPTLARPVLWAVQRLGLPAPLTAQQLEMFREASLLRRGDNPLRTVFHLEPLPFRDAVEDYL